jgi:hypothetical protein
LRYEEFLVLTPQAGAFVRGGQALADGTVWGSSSRLLVEFLLECYELYAHKEYLALGGLQELIERKTLFEEGYKLPEPFYWDLWGTLEHLRESYSDYCAVEHFDPDASEEESVASLDTQA